jgi:hypothetical protein
MPLSLSLPCNIRHRSVTISIQNARIRIAVKKKRAYDRYALAVLIRVITTGKDMGQSFSL